ncbi:MAG TPA: hypothetical protein VLW53_24735 [Candidatus Eisenbacteria bacterium]|nr:hypothetical protein [Candidatus Eisenbacteria bacterium]
MVTTRIQTTRRRLGTGRQAHAARRRLTPWPLLASVASGAAAERLGLASFGRAYAAGVALLAVVIAYLLMGAQTTQTSYDLDRLKDQNAQLVAEQDELRAQDARMHTQAGVARAATTAGLQHSNSLKYVGYQPVALDLGAPIGPARPEDTPLWQRALAAIVGGTAREAQAAGR